MPKARRIQNDAVAIERERLRMVSTTANGARANGKRRLIGAIRGRSSRKEPAVRGRTAVDEQGTDSGQALVVHGLAAKRTPTDR